MKKFTMNLKDKTGNIITGYQQFLEAKTKDEAVQDYLYWLNTGPENENHSPEVDIEKERKMGKKWYEELSDFEKTEIFQERFCAIENLPGCFKSVRFVGDWCNTPRLSPGQVVFYVAADDEYITVQFPENKDGEVKIISPEKEIWYETLTENEILCELHDRGFAEDIDGNELELHIRRSWKTDPGMAPGQVTYDDGRFHVTVQFPETPEGEVKFISQQ